MPSLLCFECESRDDRGLNSPRYPSPPRHAVLCRGASVSMFIFAYRLSRSQGKEALKRGMLKKGTRGVLSTMKVAAIARIGVRAIEIRSAWGGLAISNKATAGWKMTLG